MRRKPIVSPERVQWSRFHLTCCKQKKHPLGIFQIIFSPLPPSLYRNSKNLRSGPGRFRLCAITSALQKAYLFSRLIIPGSEGLIKLPRHLVPVPGAPDKRTPHGYRTMLREDHYAKVACPGFLPGHGAQGKVARAINPLAFKLTKTYIVVTIYP